MPNNEGSSAGKWLIVIIIILVIMSLPIVPIQNCAELIGYKFGCQTIHVSIFQILFK
jgi:hypothetical protein